MVNFAGALSGNDLGSSVSAALEIAPQRWWYLTATAGIGRAASFVGGAGVHLRWAFGPAALSAGAGMLYEGVRDGSDHSDFLGPSTTTYHYPATAWVTAETTLALRRADGIGLELAAGVARPLAATAYTCMETSESWFTGMDVTSDCSGTVSGAAPYVALRLSLRP